MNTFQHVLKESAIANVLFILALVTVISFEIIFADTVELFRGGAKVTFLLTSIALSYMAGYIFYLSTEARRRTNSIHATKLIAHRHWGRVISLVNDIFFSVTEIRDIPDDNALNENIKRRKIHDKVPSIALSFNGQKSQQVEYNYYFPCYIFPKMQERERDIANISHLLEPEIAVALDDVFNCNFKTLLGDQMVANINYNEASLSMFKDAFFDLSEKTKHLKTVLRKVYGEPPWSSNKKMQPTQ